MNNSFKQNNKELEVPKMSHIRHVKPSFFTHDEVTEMTPLARLAWIGIWTVCDKNGRFIWKAKTLKHDILPYDDCDFAAVLEEIRSKGFIVQYEVNGKSYGYVPNWKKHQAIGTKEVHRNDAYPAPETGNVPAHDGQCAETEGKGKGVGVDLGVDNGQDESFHHSTTEGMKDHSVSLNSKPKSAAKSRSSDVDSLCVLFHTETEYPLRPTADQRAQLGVLVELYGLDVVQEAVRVCASDSNHNWQCVNYPASVLLDETAMPVYIQIAKENLRVSV